MNTHLSTSDEAEREAALGLALVPGIGSRLQAELLSRFGTARRAMSASARTLQSVPGIGPQLADRLAGTDSSVARAELQRCQKHGIEVLLPNDQRYPQNLLNISDPPQALFVRGSLRPPDGLCLAIVGTRHATHYGRRIAHDLARALAKAGMTIVSGLARGIDAAAHQGALDAGGRTLAVLAGGLLQLYPSEHKELAYDISHQGCLLSEFPCDWPIQRGAFPRRNRIITGLSLGVIVVEAGDRSGALVSARHAMEQGREVFAVPGPVDSRVSRGCHALLRDGATLVETIDDVFQALGPLAQVASDVCGAQVRHPAELQLNPQEQRVLACIETQPTGIDQIVTASELPVQRVLATVSALETRRLIRRVSGQQLVRI